MRIPAHAPRRCVLSFLAGTALLLGGPTDASASPLPQAGGASGYDTIDPLATALRVLRDGVESDNEGVQHATLVALRQLRDPSLRPLFEALTKGDRWALRVDGVLGLAELSGDGMVELARIEQLPGERDREAAISGAVTLKLADAKLLRQLLEWTDLTSSQRALIAGELRRLGGSPDPELLARLATSKTPEVAGLAVAILLDMKSAESAALAAKSREQIAALPAASRANTVALVAEACSLYSLKGAGAFVASLLTLPDLPEEPRLRAIGSLLALAPSEATAAITAAIAADGSVGAMTRLASILIASGAKLPDDVWARFRTIDETLGAVSDAGMKLSSGDETGAYRKLVELERRVFLRAALDGAHRAGPSADRAFGLACLSLVLRPGPTPKQLSETLLLGLIRLAETAPEELRAALTAESTDSATRDAILIALLNAGTREAADVARVARGKASRLGEAQIAVLNARTTDKLAPAELDELVRVAGGATNVGLPVRQQAAWLWLRHAGKAAEATKALSPATPVAGASK